MPKPIQNKLRSRRGESLAEVLIAMLIIALSVLMLAAMVSAAGAINMRTRARDEQFYKELSAAETFGGYLGTQVVTGKRIHIQELDEDGHDKTDGIKMDLKVEAHGGDALLSYSAKPVSGG